MIRALTFALLVLSGCAKGSASTGKADMTVGDPADLSVGDGLVFQPDLGPDPFASQFQEVRGVMHVHSVYSHDACDGNGLPGGMRNTACWNDLRAAICSVKLDFVGLTDHPDFMRDYPLADELLFDAAKGDEAIMDGAQMVANRLKCDDGHRAIITEGYEANHTLPVAFTTKPTTTTAYGNLDDTRPIADVQAMVGELKAAGALVASVHSEGSDLSATTLLASGAEAMEWYNPHGNFKTVLGAEDGIGLGALDALDSIGSMTPFMAGSSANAHPDSGLPAAPAEVAAGRVRQVADRAAHQDHHGHPRLGRAPERERRALVHRRARHRVSAGGDGLERQDAGAGPFGRGRADRDGRRRGLDSYERILRWLENRILVSEKSAAGVKDALRAGRNYGLFSVFGAPEGFRFVGQSNGTLLEMGAAQPAPIALTVKVPKLAVALSGVPFTPADGAKVEVRASLYRTSATETTLVKETSLLGDTLTFNATEPGAYHVEVWAKPKHLVTALGTQAALADTEYLWLISNPIRVKP